MAERYSDFIWDYYGGRPSGIRRTWPGLAPGRGFGGPGAGLRAQTLWAMEMGDDNRDTGRDMEYFQAMYPEKMKKLQMRVTNIRTESALGGSAIRFTGRRSPGTPTRRRRNGPGRPWRCFCITRSAEDGSAAAA